MYKYLSILIVLLVAEICYSQAGWQRLQLSTANDRVTSVSFINANTGYIVTWANKLFKTTDKGVTWNNISTFSDTSRHCFYISAFSDSVIGMIRKTEFLDPYGTYNSADYFYYTKNAGNNWYLADIGLTDTKNFLGVKYFSKDKIFLFGRSYFTDWVSLLYKSENGGTNWFQMLTPAVYEVTYMDFKDTSNGISVFDFQSVYTTTNRGISWTQISSGISNLYKLSKQFNDIIFGIKSVQGNYILKSTNAGATFQATSPFAYSTRIRDIQFLTEQRGYVCGDSGAIFFTSNSGANWSEQITNTRKRINTIYFINNDTGYALADSGILLRTYNGGIVSINSNTTMLPSDFSLYQNYPNPFNPATKIQFAIPSTSNVVLSIYDIMGRKIKQFDYQSLPVGIHNIDVDMSEYSSGIYYYRFQARDFNQVRKMVLLK